MVGDDFDRQHVRYLLGQGLYDPRKKVLARRHIPADGQEIKLAIRNQGEATHATLFLAALWALRTFGGLGARVHRGFGTFTLTRAPHLGTGLEISLLKRNSLADLPEVLSVVGGCLSQLNVPTSQSREFASYPHFGLTTHNQEEFQYHRCEDDSIGSDAQDFADALAYTGESLRTMRTSDGFKTDEYDKIVSRYLNSGTPESAAFLLGAYGLPVGFSDPLGPKDSRGKSTRRSAVVEPLRGKEAVRRASPLWLRAYKNANEWRLRSLVFYSEWLPEDFTLRIRDTTDSRIHGYNRRQDKTVTKPSQDEVNGYLNDWFGEPDGE